MNKIFYKDPRTGEEIQFKWFTSDTHYSHKNIARLANRQKFLSEDSTVKMDTEMFTNWNSQVGTKDNVLHLGDVALGDVSQSLDYIKKANGNKYLITGNHDHNSRFFSASRRERDTPLYEDAFSQIFPEEGILLTALIDGKEINFYASHYPRTEEIHDKHKMKHLKTFIPSDIPMIHGHTHSPSIHQEGFENNYHVGVDAHDFKLVEDSQILGWLSLKNL